jgi:hypothetical protein
VLYFYFPEKEKNEILKSIDNENTYNEISNYLNTNLKLFPGEYKGFFNSLSDKGFNELFSHYCNRMSTDASNKLWLKSHSNELDQFAIFLDKNLPGK